MQTPFGTLPEWVAWLVGIIISTILGIWATYQQLKKPRPPNLQRPAFQQARKIIRETPSKPDIYALLRWQTKYGRSSLPGRRKQLQQLLSWAKKGRVPKIAIIAAPGGAGKTRLAMEAAEALAKKGWEAGFHELGDGDLQLPSKKRMKGLFRQRGLFLVIDYPEAREPDKLRELLCEVRDWQKKVQVPTRVLLLARVEQAADLQRKMQQHLHGLSIMELSPLRALDEKDALQLARDVHDALKGCSPFHALAAGWEEQFTAWLRQDEAQHGLPLFVIAAILHAMLRQHGGFELKARDILKNLAAREIERAEQASMAVGLPEEALPRLLGLAALAGGLDGPAIQRLRGQDGLGEHTLNEDALRKTPWWHRERNALVLEAPDRPAAAFVAKALLEQPHTNLPEWLWLALQDVADDFVERLPRPLWDLGEFDWQAKECLTTALKSMVEQDDDAPKRAKAFAPVGAMQNHLTASFAVAVGNVLLEHAQDDANRASLLNNLSVHLSLDGRREEALEKAQAAADIYHQLAEDKPQAFLPDLAMSLNNLATSLSELGQHKEALEKAQEAADIYLQLTKDNPQVFRPDLAMSLNNMAAFLSKLGRREGALEKAQKAADIYRQLAEDNPEAFLPYLAGSLNNLANRLSELGRHEEALEKAQKAVEIRLQQAEDNPQAFLPYLAGSLNNLANRLSELGWREEALEKAQEAADIYRQLAENNSQAFRPPLAGSLNNLANRLSELGQREDALEKAQEAVKIYRQLVEDNPQAFRPALAMTLNTLAIRLSELGRREVALEKAQEAVEIRRQLAEDNPQAFQPDLAGSLNNLANILSELGRREEALEKAQEATDIYHQLSKDNPQAFQPILAKSLGSLGRMLLRSGRAEEAREAFAEGLRVIAPHAQALPMAHGPLAQALALEYRRACEAAGQAPDEELLEPLEPVLATVAARLPEDRDEEE